MVQFKIFLNFPTKLNDRNKNIDSIHPFIKNFNIVEQEGSNFLVIESLVNKYNVNISIEGGKILNSAATRVSCSCASFNFEFAKVLFDMDGLIYSDNFKETIKKVPKKTNLYSLPSGCKHIISLARFINKYKSRFNI